jgi:hypothetical protein
MLENIIKDLIILKIDISTIFSFIFYFLIWNSIVYSQTPGGIFQSNLKGWFKADNYSQGSYEWRNSANNPDLPRINTNNPPTYESANPLWNYNTSLGFGGKTSNQGFRAIVDNVTDILDPDQGTIIAIASYKGGGDNRGVSGYRSTNFYKNELSILYNETWFRGDINSSGVSLNWTTPINPIPSIRSMRFLRTVSGGLKKIALNSFLNSNKDNEDIDNVTAAAGDLSNNGKKSFSVGEIFDVHFYEGSIAEVIALNRVASSADRIRAESYLAIKYGTTLGTTTNPISYTSSTGQDVWKADTKYQRNIIGIARDDKSGLLQKQSHQIDDSVRIYRGALNTTNKGNTSTIKNDPSFVIMGGNGKKLQATDASNAEMHQGIPINGSCDLFSVIERKWRVQQTRMDDEYNIDIKLNSAAMQNGFSVSDLRLIVDNDDNLSNGWIGCYSSGSTPGFTISYNMTEGSVSIKGISSQIPSNNISYITIGSIYSGTPLPIKLTEFSANCDFRKTILNWTTASETNNDYFTIERSLDGSSFETLSTIKGKGNKNSTSFYSFTDYTNQVGISYYRLSQTDFDGKETALKTISTNCEGELEVVIHPNPTNNGVYLTLNNSEKYLEVTIYNLSGKVISRNEVHGSAWLQLPNEDGIYLIKYVLDGEEHVEKVVKI